MPECMLLDAGTLVVTCIERDLERSGMMNRGGGGEWAENCLSCLFFLSGTRPVKIEN